ncbi:MAG TPA: class I mannose-6-phosphate isomerase [Sphingorhabdus sp.]|jgi:mannose-6-phosphate isomerase|uniref:class I mannose-6-phosphate isomerase n=1 Tax=Sphingorhabdus sp. TaxID=1902408 RepID=UPI002BF7B507|nr:class I mannose-6-phosphate isomerase [Sphingorhabdus sp.]HMT41107.1 class I mannose-6-phosphate isomerase [Sphingorhabdus sp.]HMU22239.1 class I mannose-6-phosphate isomerase [Sphingorhabdus sp.]
MFLERQFVEKPWGRDDLPPEFGALGGQRIGEIWYNGVGQTPLPLLVKWMFTSEKLSIQVHPSEADARRRGLPSGKEECWYIVDAEPGAVLGIGTKRVLSADELRAASLSGEIEELLDWKTVRAGDYFYIPAGTVHAIGAGITLVEVQQPADITYRLYDYGRPRELHLEDGVSVAIPVPYKDARSGNVSGNLKLAEGPHFWFHHIVDDAGKGTIKTSGSHWIVPISGHSMLNGVPMNRGDCIMVDSLEQIHVERDSSLLIAGIAKG